MATRDENITGSELLLPLMLVALTLLGLIIFQTTAVSTERSNLKSAFDGQTKPFEQAMKVQTQLDALASGTMKLSEQGNKDAKAVLERLKQAGLAFSNAKEDKTAPAATPAPTPAPAN